MGGGLRWTSGAFGGNDGVLAEAEKLKSSCQLGVGIGDALFVLEHQDLIRGKMLLPTSQGTVVHASLKSIGHRATVAAKTSALLVRQSGKESIYRIAQQEQ
jgi:hypothetical protein